MIKRFDLVKIKTIKNVKWVSGPSGRAARPDGVWTVVGGSYNGQITIAKDQTVCMVPEGDIVKVADYSIDNVFEKIKAIRPGEEPENGEERKEGTETKDGRKR
jgi:hypothetical protein